MLSKQVAGGETLNVWVSWIGRRWVAQQEVEIQAGNLPRMTAKKPLMRGWSHALAAVAAVALTAALAWRSRDDGPRLLSFVIFGASMIELYAVSAAYHIGRWRASSLRALRAMDHANIFVLIAGTYTPICFNVLSGWVRIALLCVIWLLALAGVALQVMWRMAPRGVSTSLYVGMGWVAVLALPAFWAALPSAAVGMLLLGGVLYTIGALVYGLRWPNPFPHIFGFHEVFHLFVIAGSVAFVVVVWLWVLPFPRW